VHVLHLYKDYYPVHGGIEQHVQTLAEGLQRRGIQNSVLVCQPAQSASQSAVQHLNGVTIHRVPRHLEVASSPFSWALWSQIAQIKPDIIHLQMPWPTGDVMAALHRRIPLVVSYQSDVVRQQGWLRLYAPVLRHTLHQARRILVSSAQYRDTSPWLAPFVSKCQVVPLGIEPRTAALPERVAHWSAQLPFPFVLWVGRMRYYKGLHDAIHALQYVPPEVRLVLVGDGPERVRLQHLASDMGVAERVIWLGTLANVEIDALYSVARLFVFPSHLRAEAYGLAMLEALSAGLPAISCDIGTATSAINRDGHTGLVVPPSQPRALAAALCTLLDNPELRLTYARQAKQWVQQYYTVGPMVDAVVDVYQSL
jgi:rhamnosyl/mannosyltransferase